MCRALYYEKQLSGRLIDIPREGKRISAPQHLGKRNVLRIAYIEQVRQ